MLISKHKYSIWFRAIAIGVVCLLFVNTISWATPATYTPSKTTLAAQSIFKPILDVLGWEYLPRIDTEMTLVIDMAIRGLVKDRPEYRSWLNINAELDKQCSKDKRYRKLLELTTNPERLDDGIIEISVRTTRPNRRQREFTVRFKGNKIDDLLDTGKIEIIAVPVRHTAMPNKTLLDKADAMLVQQIASLIDGQEITSSIGEKYILVIDKPYLEIGMIAVSLCRKGKTVISNHILGFKIANNRIIELKVFLNEIYLDSPTQSVNLVNRGLFDASYSIQAKVFGLLPQGMILTTGIANKTTRRSLGVNYYTDGDTVKRKKDGFVIDSTNLEKVLEHTPAARALARLGFGKFNIEAAGKEGSEALKWLLENKPSEKMVDGFVLTAVKLTPGPVAIPAPFVTTKAVTRQSDPSPQTEQLIKQEEISDNLKVLRRASRYLDKYPVDETINLSLIPKEDLEENMKTWARIIALHNSYGLDVNYIFKSDDEGYGAEAKRMLFDKINKISSKTHIDADKLKARVTDICRPNALQVHIMRKENLEKLKVIPEGVLPIAMSEGMTLEGTPLRDFMSASTIGLAQAACKRMQIEGDPRLIEAIEQHILPRMRHIYQRLFPDQDIKEIITKETILNMIDDNPIVRRNLAIALALPPIIRLSIEYLKDYHDKLQSSILRAA